MQDSAMRVKTPLQKQRYAYLNILRCAAILLVISLHCTSGFVSNAAFFGSKTWWACMITNSFSRMGVPLFFMISGYLLLSSEKTRDIRTFYQKRLARLAVPFLFWDVVYFLERCALEGVPPDGLLFFQELAAKGSRYHLWFVYQILGLYLLAPFLKKIVEHSNLRELILFFLLILLQPTFFRFVNVMQSAIQIAPFRALVEGFAGYFLAGYLLGTYSIPPRGRRAVYLLGLAGLLGGILGNYRTSSPEGIFLYFSENYSITQYMTAGALFLLVKETADRFPRWAVRGAEFFSGLTFGVYFIHVLVLDAYGAALSRLGWNPAPGLRIAAGFLVVSLTSTCLAYLFSRIPLLRRLI
ncbi:MAG: acyltransferase family protein [Oscillibacter sp.]|nr:acyltransferase family protein [Oscillibacter sp.]